ncbi:MAG: histidine phosphatase family protein [Promethearchaeota archaeon]|nr:MAG: histidine phosphatase family protein [Candidatus Lokiarchaeota archaeon]
MCAHSPEFSPVSDSPQTCTHISPYYFTLIRHGETEANSRNAFIGITDSPLNATGRAQAQATAQYLVTQKWKFELILSSPLQRCTETARIMAANFDMPFQILSYLTERNYGIFENKTEEEVSRAYPHLLADYLVNKPFVLIPEGESAIDLEDRIQNLVWSHIPSQYPKIRHILFITHLNPVRAFLRLLGVESWDIYFKKFSNASVTRLRTDLQTAEVLISDYSCYNDPACNVASNQEDMAQLK